MGGTNVVSGLSSGIDWRDILDQLKAVEYKRVELIQDRRKTYDRQAQRLADHQYQTARIQNRCRHVKQGNRFQYLYDRPVIKHRNGRGGHPLGHDGHRRGSGQLPDHRQFPGRRPEDFLQQFASDTTALGLSGDLLVNGKTVTISATDTLSSLRDKINAVNTGDDPSKVTASIVHYDTDDHRLILTSDEEGAAGMTLENGGAPDIWGRLASVMQ